MPIVRRSRKYRAIIGRRCEAYAPLTSGYNGLVGGSNPLGPTTHSRFLPRCGDAPRMLESHDGRALVPSPKRSTSYGVSPYIAFSWPWANARAGGMSIL